MGLFGAIGAVGSSLRRAGGGMAGRTLQGAVLGAAAGGAYGAISGRQTILGGAMSGAMLGGTGAAAWKMGRAGMRSMGAFNKMMKSAPRMSHRAMGSKRGLAMMSAGASGAFMRGALSAGKADFRKAMRQGRNTYKHIARTWRKAANPIASTMKTTQAAAHVGAYRNAQSGARFRNNGIDAAASLSFRKKR